MPRHYLLSIIAAIAGAFLAQRKGRNAVGWAIACFLFPPAVILPAILPPVVRPGDLRQCPKCSAPVMKGSGDCPRCGGPMPIDMAECGSCGKFVPDGAKCSECGKSLR